MSSCLSVCQLVNHGRPAEVKKKTSQTRKVKKGSKRRVSRKKRGGIARKRRHQGRDLRSRLLVPCGIEKESVRRSGEFVIED